MGYRDDPSWSGYIQGAQPGCRMVRRMTTDGLVISKGHNLAVEWSAELTTGGLVISKGHNLAVEWSAELTTDGLVISKGHILTQDSPTKDDLGSEYLLFPVGSCASQRHPAGLTTDGLVISKGHNLAALLRIRFHNRDFSSAPFEPEWAGYLSLTSP